MYNSFTVITVPSSSISNNDLSSYPFLEQDDVIIHDYLNNNNLKTNVIINIKMHRRQNNSSKLSRLM